MSKSESTSWRIRRLAELLNQRFGSNRSALGRALGHYDGSFVRQMAAGASPISEKTVRRIESLPGLHGWFAEPAARSAGEAVADVGDVGDAGDTADAAAEETNIVPVLGTTQTGALRSADPQRGPGALRHGDLYVEAFVQGCGAYGLAVAGDAMSPRGLHGEWLVVEPAIPPQPGDDVVLATRDGTVLVQQIVASHGGQLMLAGVGSQPARITRELGDIDYLHRISVRLPTRAAKRHIDRPGYRGPDRRLRQMRVAVERRRQPDDYIAIAVPSRL